MRHALLDAFDAAHELAITSILENVDVSGASPSVNTRGFAEEFDELAGLGVIAATVFGDDGRELAHASVDGSVLRAAGPTREVTGNGADAVVIRRRELRRNGAGTVVVARRAADVGRQLDSLLRGLLLLLPAALLGSLGVGWTIAGQSLRPVRETFDRQRTFMADASHELRTPLAVIRAQAEVQLEGGDDATRRRALEVVARSAEQMGKLVDDLLFLSRSDGSGLTLSRASVSLDDLVEDVVDAFSPIAVEKGSRIELTAAPGGAEVEADPAQLQRLVAILVDNAIRHGSPSIVAIAVGRTGREAFVTVEDAGPGVDDALLPTLFERFVRGPAAAKNEGHGLGLAIARAIATAHRGTITLERSSLGGLAARVKLPLRG